jgi:F-box protein, helicase, 18
MSGTSNISETVRKLSEEQLRPCHSKAKSIKIKACAGAGKTTALVGFSEINSDKRLLLLAYNKSIVSDNLSRFPDNVDLKTTHGLAFESVGSAYMEAGKIGDAKVTDIAATFNVSLIIAMCMKNTVNAYLGSDENQIRRYHVDADLAERTGAKSDADLDVLVELSNQLWGQMCDPINTRMLMPHDGYLKIYIDSKPNLSEMYDGILLDEGQDSSGAVAGFFMRQNCQRILVGDHHQSINKWRGAINAMEKFECDENFSLTTSFRFGKDIADIANEILGTKGETEKICGVGKSVSRGMPTAVICRTNASVLESAISLGMLGKRVYLIGGVDSYKFSQISDVYELTYGNRANIKNPFYTSFESIDGLEEYAFKANDIESKQICKTVRKHGSRTLKMIERATSNAVDDPHKASVIIGTGHKTKGMEFDTVVLEDDFMDLGKKARSGRDQVEETNLLYVGCTRAKLKLHPSKSLKKWLERK